MSKIHWSLLVGGTAVVSMFLSSSLLLAAPEPFPGKTVKFVPPPPAYMQYVRGQDQFAAATRAKSADSTNKVVAAAAAASQKDTQQQTDKAKSSTHQSSQTVTQTKAKTVKPKTSAPVQVASRSSGSAVAPGLVDYALSLRGIPYKYGGTTTAGFDCSGYTQNVFAKYGIKLPRTSFDQFKVGTPVAKGDLQPGDLVFFTTYAPGASHVGISLGGGDFVHASINGVKINSISGYYAERFLGGRRVK